MCCQVKQNNFQPLEVLDRGSETQFQVGENLNRLTILFTFRKPYLTFTIKTQKYFNNYFLYFL